MKIYLVGGAVRDAQLGRQVTEKDWVVVGATPEQMLAKGYTQVGKDFPVFLHPATKEEYALARTERKSGKGYTGFVCHATPEVTLEQDLQRRDLTINAMAQSADGHIVDPYHGLSDLNKRLLRHVSPAFAEDPLRVFRVARFAARYAHLGFTVAPETITLMQTMAADDELAHLTAERVCKETMRSLTEQHPQVYFQTLEQSHSLVPWFSELTTILPQVNQQLSQAAQYTNDPLILWAVIGAQCPVTHAKALCARLKCANNITELCVLSSRFCHILHHPISPQACLDVFNQCDVWRKHERFLHLLSVVKLTSSTPELQCKQNEKIKQALFAAKELNAQKFIAEGLQGPEIGSAMNHGRLTLIRQHLI
ncbi:CCA tRNA nucleotidyltransferase [Alteromonas sp. C1M14]|uniref:CCA tRNA nucleotidyltransferase n=1 Tax=Alteromonas sp. C1M14 TaxID=2841567 RepID=UPI001C089C35|nr:CCA tRNA nucleotidyltransferase [Alteromonas sp. C1M14]MBU2977799.1 CCA tRNA nucleotidyltransferase [Alteromonas sp. C1M14]